MGETVGTDAGIVEEHVDPAERRDRCVNGCRYGCVVTHVGDRSQAGGADLLAFGAQCLELPARSHRVPRVRERRGDVERDDVVSRAGEGEARGVALSVGGARDERGGPIAHRARYGSRWESNGTWSASLNTFVAIMIAPNAVRTTICSSV